MVRKPAWGKHPIAVTAPFASFCSMNTLKPNPEKVAAPSPLTDLAGAIFDGVMSGLGTVVGAVQGTLGIGHAPAMAEKPTPSKSSVQAAHLAPKTTAAKRSPLPKLAKTRTIKVKTLKTPKQKVSQVKKTTTKALSKPKALRHK